MSSRSSPSSGGAGVGDVMKADTFAKWEGQYVQRYTE